MEYDKVGDWIYEIAPNIRSRIVEYYDFEGDLCADIQFEVFKRPYFYGLIGKKKWIWSITTNDIGEGLSFSKFLLKIF